MILQAIRQSKRFAIPAKGFSCATGLLMAASFGGTANAANGDVDATFGNGGLALGGVLDADYNVSPKPLVLPDGSVVTCNTLLGNAVSGSDFFIQKFRSDGTPDTDFSFDGQVTVDFDGNAGGDSCRAVAVDGTGRLVVAGTTTIAGNTDFAVARLTVDGLLDATLGNGSGKVLVPFDLGGNLDDEVSSLAIQSDGRIVVGGWVTTATNGDDFAVLRLLDDGTRDPAFNQTGRVTVGFNLPGSATKIDQALALQIDPQGRIVLAGFAYNTIGGDFAVARLLPGGQLDANFSADGRMTLAMDLGASKSEAAYTMALQSDGRVVIGGVVDTSPSSTINYDFAIARLLPDGSPDASFGFMGATAIPFDLTANGGDVVLGLAVQGNGSIVAGGFSVGNGGNGRGAIARVLRNGALDGTFGTGGKKTYQFAASTSDNQLFTGIALQGTQIIAAGIIDVADGQFDTLAVRLQNDLIFASGFE